MAKPSRIFIVGHTGAGKYERGEALAKKLDWQLIDANPGLERYVGRNLDEILGRQGEEAFHQCEAEIISHYIGKENIVVLLEEAVIVTEKNRKLLSPEQVCPRLSIALSGVHARQAQSKVGTTYFAPAALVSHSYSLPFV